MKDIILLVDDSEELRAVIGSMLEDEGFVVLEADGAPDALQLLHNNKISLVLSDIQMPKGGGLELASRIKQMHLTSIPVVLMSGGVALTKDDLQYLGVVNFLPKPFSKSQLKAVLHSLCKPAVA